MTHTVCSAQLYVIAGSGDGAAARLTAALAAANVSTVLLPAGDKETLARLVAIAREREVATLVSDDAALSLAVDADGVHLSWSPDLAERYAAARALVGGDAIVGVDAGQSRHDAMVLGEAGADYVAFSLAAGTDDEDERHEMRADMVAWWSAVFEVACVAFDVGGAEEAGELVQAGADFIAIRLPDEGDAGAVADFVGGISRSLRPRALSGEDAA